MNKKEKQDLNIAKWVLATIIEKATIKDGWYDVSNVDITGILKDAGFKSLAILGTLTRIDKKNIEKQEPTV